MTEIISMARIVQIQDLFSHLPPDYHTVRALAIRDTFYLIRGRDFDQVVEVYMNKSEEWPLLRNSDYIFDLEDGIMKFAKSITNAHALAGHLKKAGWKTDMSAITHLPEHQIT